MLRSSSTAILAAGVLIVSGAFILDGGPVPDPELYVAAGCATCHGPTAAGAFGPTLAGTELSFEAFLGQLRSPRGMMPPVETSLVTDEEARRLFDYVAGLDEPEGGPAGGTGCPGGQHGRGHRGAGAEHCPHHQGQSAAGQGQGRGRGGACRHGACRHGDGAPAEG